MYTVYYLLSSDSGLFLLSGFDFIFDGVTVKTENTVFLLHVVNCSLVPVRRVYTVTLYAFR